MAQSELEKKNTVSSKGQVKEKVNFYGKPGGSPRIMMIGNSITHHGYLPSIGWYGEWGMAASAAEKDYVHLMMKAVAEKFPEAEFCVVQAASWERSYKDYDCDQYFSPAKDFKPDVITCVISANIPDGEFEGEAFAESLHKLHTYLSGGRNDVKIFESTSFFDNEKKSEGARLYGRKYGAEVIEISDICRDKENLAIGLFEHEGIQCHPGDKGMAEIAKRLSDAVLKVL